SQFYWSDRPSAETVREYIAYEYGPGVVDTVARAVDMLEATQTSKWSGQPTSPDAYDLLLEADAKLSPAAKTAWRWRILLLRARLDRERLAQPVYRFLGEHWPTPACEPALRELTRIYHADHAHNPVRPPLRP